MSAAGDYFRADAILPLEGTPKNALAIWVNETGKLEPTQATGGLF